MAMALEEDKRYNCDGAMDDNSNKQCKARDKSRWVPVGVLVTPGRRQ